jgi:ABC-type dipeptide/oligopeptide/nickel transport system ATPase subunit
MKMADSGEILGQWQAFRNILNDVSIAVKAGTVMGLFGSVGLSILVGWCPQAG